MEEMAELETRGYKIIYGMDDWGTVQPKWIDSIGLQVGMEYIRWVRDLLNVKEKDFIDDQEDHTGLEGVNCNMIINAGYRDDIKDREDSVGRYYSVRSFLLDNLESNPETHFVARKREYFHVWSGLI